MIFFSRHNMEDRSGVVGSKHRPSDCSQVGRSDSEIYINKKKGWQSSLMPIDCAMGVALVVKYH